MKCNEPCVRIKNQKRKTVGMIIFGGLSLLIMVFMYFGGFSTDESADPEEFAHYAQIVDEMKISET